FKSAFQYTLPFGINFTTKFNAQKGETYSRTLSITGLNQGTFTATVDHLGQFFYPTIKLWDARGEKSFRITEKQKIVPFFNLLNRNDATGWVTGSGITYQRQLTAILNPRIFRIGANYTF